MAFVEAASSGVLIRNQPDADAFEARLPSGPCQAGGPGQHVTGVGEAQAGKVILHTAVWISPGTGFRGRAASRGLPTPQPWRLGHFPEACRLRFAASGEPSTRIATSTGARWSSTRHLDADRLRDRRGLNRKDDRAGRRKVRRRRRAPPSAARRADAAEGGLGDDAAACRDHRHELGQVVAGDVFDDLAAAAGERAVGECDGDAEDQIARPPKAAAERAAVVGRQHAADGGVVGPERVERQALAVTRQLRSGGRVIVRPASTVAVMSPGGVSRTRFRRRVESITSSARRPAPIGLRPARREHGRDSPAMPRPRSHSPAASAGSRPAGRPWVSVRMAAEAAVIVKSAPRRPVVSSGCGR